MKDKIKAIDKQMGTNAVIVGLWLCGFGEALMWKINFNECHRERCFVENKLFATLDTVRKVVIKTFPFFLIR
jgi:hypothetical protein